MAVMAGDLARIRGELYAAVLSDTLDAFGRTGQVMRPFVRPLSEETVLCGRARTGLYAPAYHVGEGENPYAVEIALVDDLRADDVAVLACDGPTERIAPWGELLSTAAALRGAAGCVTDGLVRDVRAVRRMGFPVFHGGIGPLDSRGRGHMISRDVPVECAGVPVRTGDLVFGDADGVVVVPAEMEEPVIAAALEKVRGEDRTRDALARGSKLADVYDTYGVL
jgi:regulator of RNase E activity RraA